MCMCVSVCVSVCVCVCVCVCVKVSIAKRCFINLEYFVQYSQYKISITQF